ncbi:MAG: hypothetical protein ACOX8E_07395 [Ruminococcus sp.]
MKCIWVRIEESKDKEALENILLSLIKEDETLAGELPVYVFVKKTRAIDKLSRIYDLSEAAVNVLKERFGDGNVKCTERVQTYETYEPVPKEPLERIADSLEWIADSLEKIAACVDGREDSRFFSVGGEMDICR